MKWVELLRARSGAAHRVRSALLALLALLALFDGGVSAGAGVLCCEQCATGKNRKAQGGDHEFFHYVDISLLHLSDSTLCSQ